MSYHETVQACKEIALKKLKKRIWTKKAARVIMTELLRMEDYELYEGLKLALNELRGRK